MRSINKTVAILVLGSLMLSSCAESARQTEATVTLATPTPILNTPDLPAHLELSDISRITKALKCEKKYPLASDYQRMSPMRGVYCVTGLSENSRSVRIYESEAAARDILDLYVPYQTGGRKVYLMANWFIYGLPSDMRTIQKLKLKEARPNPNFQKTYPVKQDMCIGLISEALRGAFSSPEMEKLNIESAEKLFPGAKEQLHIAIAKYGAGLKIAYSSNEFNLIEQRLSEATESYRPFCARK